MGVETTGSGLEEWGLETKYQQNFRNGHEFFDEQDHSGSLTARPGTFRHPDYGLLLELIPKPLILSLLEVVVDFVISLLDSLAEVGSGCAPEPLQIRIVRRPCSVHGARIGVIFLYDLSFEGQRCSEVGLKRQAVRIVVMIPIRPALSGKRFCSTES